jgi:hypothetical protein
MVNPFLREAIGFQKKGPADLFRETCTYACGVGMLLALLALASSSLLPLAQLDASTVNQTYGAAAAGADDNGLSIDVSRPFGLGHVLVGSAFIATLISIRSSFRSAHDEEMRLRRVFDGLPSPTSVQDPLTGEAPASNMARK